VVGHYGEVSEGSMVSFPSAGGADGGKRTFVVSNEILLLLQRAGFGDHGDGRLMMSIGIQDNYSKVFTLVDGEVMIRTGSRTRGVEAEAISPVDILLGAKVLVELGAGLGARLITAFTRRSAARAAAEMMAGPTRAAVTQVVKKEPVNFTVLAEGETIAGTSVPETVHIRVGNREFMVGRDANAMTRPTNPAIKPKPIGPATKHLGEKVLKVPGGTQNRVFPMSSLAEGLREAERRIANGVPYRVGQPGVFQVVIKEAGQDGWDFIIDTNQVPWRVFHAQINRLGGKSAKFGW
jgi:hypothetical protein